MKINKYTEKEELKKFITGSFYSLRDVEVYKLNDNEDNEINQDTIILFQIKTSKSFTIEYLSVLGLLHKNVSITASSDSLLLTWTEK